MNGWGIQGGDSPLLRGQGGLVENPQNCDRGISLSEIPLTSFLRGNHISASIKH
jgi:hypothetical protein